jgi:DNA-binding MarR family transcriptional regulator
MTDESAQRAPGPSAHADQAPLKLEDFLPHRLNVCASLVSAALSRIYAERYKIGVPEWRVLVTLGQYGIMTAKAVGAYSHMHKTKVSRAGREIYGELTPIAIDFVHQLMDTLDANERAVLDRALKKLTERTGQFVPDIAKGGDPR